MKLLGRISRHLSRPSNETALLRSPWSVNFRYAVFAVLFVGFAGVEGTLLLNKVREWRSFHPEVPVSGDAWRILAEEQPGSGPENTALWNSGIRREAQDADHPSWPTFKRPAHYWLGAEFGPSVLRTALSKNANQLLIGWINGPYQVWVDGQLAARGPGWEETEPVVLRVPMSRLDENRPLRVAIHIDNPTEMETSPDFFNCMEGGEGFISTLTENSFRTNYAFGHRVRPFSLTVAYMAVALLFLFFWAASPVRQEYFFMSTFSLLCGFLEAQRVDIFRFQLSSAFADGLNNGLTYAVGFSGLLLGMSFARQRAAAFRWVVPVAALIPLTLVLGAALKLIPLGLDFKVWNFGRFWAVPFCYALSGTFCCLEAYHLRNNRARGAHLPIRMRRLILFGIGMLGVSAFAINESWQFVPGSYRIIRLFNGFEFFGFVMLLSAVALREYRDQELIVQRAPVSVYHRRPVLPVKISGALIAVDIKNSEALFRAGDKRGNSGLFVETCLSHLWNAVARNGGVVLRTDGDGLHAFFDADQGAKPLVRAQQALDDMVSELRTVGEQLHEQHQLPIDLCTIRFRAGIAMGDIQPIWQDRGTERYASWVEAGTSHPFVESARLMALERDAPRGSPANLAVFTEEAALQIELEAGTACGRWTTRGLALPGKHGVLYRVALYEPLAPPSQPRQLRLVG